MAARLKKMKDSLTFIGLFYLPDNPEKELHGTLRFNSQNGIELELLGELDDIWFWRFKKR